MGAQVINYHPLRVVLLCHVGVILLGEEAAELSSLTTKGDLIFSVSAWLTMPKVRRESSGKTLQFLNNPVWAHWMKWLWENDLIIISNTGAIIAGDTSETFLLWKLPKGRELQKVTYSASFLCFGKRRYS